MEGGVWKCIKVFPLDWIWEREEEGRRADLFFFFFFFFFLIRVNNDTDRFSVVLL